MITMLQYLNIFTLIFTLIDSHQKFQKDSRVVINLCIISLLDSPIIHLDVHWRETDRQLEVEVMKDFLALSLELHIQVMCVVKAEPKAVVRWYKNNLLLTETDKRQMETIGRKHVLFLKNLKNDGKM